ncbi:hypothetical protein BAY59_04505 [Prauserella coralliicola]|nr:hypothetical protein BAY59_04505 [Prauserella coralliicola]
MIGAGGALIGRPARPPAAIARGGREHVPVRLRSPSTTKPPRTFGWRFVGDHEVSSPRSP